MSSSTIDDASSIAFVKSELRQRLRALQSEQQHLQQTAQRVGLLGDAAGQCRAAWRMLQLQPNFGCAAVHMQQAARAAQQSAHANTLRLLYDQTAVNKTRQCLKLDAQARLLQTVVGSRPYNRMHPRFAL